MVACIERGRLHCERHGSQERWLVSNVVPDNDELLSCGHCAEIFATQSNLESARLRLIYAPWYYLRVGHGLAHEVKTGGRVSPSNCRPTLFPVCEVTATSCDAAQSIHPQATEISTEREHKGFMEPISMEIICLTSPSENGSQLFKKKQGMG